jgi:hypothetical protein
MELCINKASCAKLLTPTTRPPVMVHAVVHVTLVLGYSYSYGLFQFPYPFPYQPSYRESSGVVVWREAEFKQKHMCHRVPISVHGV